MNLHDDYLNASLKIGKRPQVWKYTVLVDGVKLRFERRANVPDIYAGTLTYEADPEALAEAEVWDQKEREIFETGHCAWKDDLFEQYSSLLTREQFDRAYEILEECTPSGTPLSYDEIAEHFEELYGFLLR
jgi:hypothetical protein